jgi:hypothetical protein
MNKLNKEKICQAIGYFEWKVGRKIPLKELFALVYLADRYHLRKYASLAIGGNTLPFPEPYFIVDPSLPPINFEVAHYLGLHPEEHDRFMVELDLDQ